jgi:hypothetical protein
MPRAPLEGERVDGAGYGVAAWSSPAWLTAATEWIDSQLAAVGWARTGPVEPAHVRPWAAVLGVPTSGGAVWMKAAGPGTAFEVPLYGLLASAAPEHVLTPLAADPARAWLLLPDGGPTLGARPEGVDRGSALVEALVQYGRLQRTLAAHVDEMLALGVADMRPAAMPARFEEALRVVGDADGVASQVAALRPTVLDWCRRLEASPVPPSLDHNDLHPWNVLEAGEGAGFRYYDWGDAVVAHPFAAMLVPLGFVQGELGDDLAFARARDRYLGEFADLAPPGDLVETLETACRVAKIARVLTWERALRASREQGEPLDPRWESAPRETLATLLNDSYLLTP